MRRWGARRRRAAQLERVAATVVRLDNATGTVLSMTAEQLYLMAKYGTGSTGRANGEWLYGPVRLIIEVGGADDQ